jgi:ketosteroid isomerase-like protein
MPEKNVEVVREAFASVGAGNWDQLAHLLHPEIEWRDAEQVFDLSKVLRGDEVRRGWEEWVEAFDAYTTKVTGYLDVDPWVICEVQWRPKGGHTEIAVEGGRAFLAAEVREGKVARVFAGDPEAVRKAIESLGE